MSAPGLSKKGLSVSVLSKDAISVHSLSEEGVSVPSSSEELVATSEQENIELSQEQLMQLTAGDYVEIDGEMYKVEFAPEQEQAVLI